MSVSRWSAAVGLAVLLAASSPAAAQYFGRNKVQYKDLKFEVLKTKHFDVYFYRQEREAARQGAEMAERWYARFAQIFEHQLHGSQPLILYASHPDFEQTNAIPGELGEGTGGVTEPFKRRIVLPLGGPLAESDHVIGHELVHAFQYDITSMTGDVSGMPALERLPLWFVEGMAEYLSLGPVDPNTTMWMRDAASREKMPRIKDLNNEAKYFPYRWGQALWAYITGRWGDHVVASLLRSAAISGDVEGSLRRVTGLSSDELSKQWQQALRESANAVRQQARPVTDYGRVLEKGQSEIAGLNVSPAISPDGRRMMFLSQRSLLSVDLYLADAQTGKVLRKVVNTAVDPHFSSLEFIYSAGAWAPDSRRFVFSVVRGGQPALVLLDVNSNRQQEVAFPDLGEIFNPTWSPDGRSIAFSALQGGLTDLFLYDLRSRTTRRLTNDAFADLQPAFSPDGRTLAFVTDRFSTRLSTLDIGNYQLALMDLSSGTMRPVPGGAAGKNINPQWATDNSLLFVSDRTGVSNIYRTEVDALGVTQVTNLTTGVSGITAISPAISYAPAAHRLVFSVYEEDKYNIYASESASALAGRAPANLTGVDAAKLPPARRVSDQLLALQDNPTIGLPAASGAKVQPYRPHLSLDFAGQPYIGVGVDPYGTFAGGGVALSWSDMLGNYNLGTAVQINSGFGGFRDTLRNSGGILTFVDLTHRWNWGATVGQMPLLAGGFSTGVITSDNGTPVGVQQTALFRQLERTAQGVVAYPFNQAQRVEFSAGFSNISFDQEVQTIQFDPVSGNVISEQTQTLPAGQPLNLGTGSAALVYDTTSFGATSPVLGQRYRLQVSPTVGTLRFNGVLADYRRYFMPAPFYTIAARVLHYGRYGSGSEDPRLIPLYLGYPDLVRGYDFNSFGANDCTPNATSSCPQFDRLLGSRILVANLEFRFPLLRPFGVSQRMYGPLPVEVGLFTDAGVAWDRGEKPKIFGGQRQGVSSAGVALRANVFGFAVAEFDFVRPFQRTSRGWVWSFNLAPGF